MSKLPWLVSSGVCIFQDGFILFLIYLYSGPYGTSQSLINVIDADINASRSKGIMLPSPCVIVDYPKKHKKRKYKKHKKKKRKKNKDEMNEKQEADSKGMYHDLTKQLNDKNRSNPYILTHSV